MSEKMFPTVKDEYEDSKHKEAIDKICQEFIGKSYQESLEMLRLAKYVIENKFTLRSS